VNGKLLRDTRLDRRLTLHELERLSGVNVRTISELELGQIKSPSYDSVMRLAAALGLDPLQLRPVEIPAGTTEESSL
jgi:transcriptional regulator with XRE-family HTH domain